MRLERARPAGLTRVSRVTVISDSGPTQWNAVLAPLARAGPGRSRATPLGNVTVVELQNGSTLSRPNGCTH
jgi:hypothetical protein